jgi:DNA-binding GntR family transcriptional regulator
MSSTAKTLVRSSPLQRELARQIMEKIRDEGWSPGARLSEQGLAQALGVSRSPVRAALELLTEHGLVGPLPKRGFGLLRCPDGVDVVKLIPKSESEEVYAAIMADRANGRLPQEVSEAELIPRYGVSRGVVRKVLMRCAAEGLAQRLRGHGWRFVDTLESHEAITESYEFRIVVECAALLSPAFRVDPDRFRQLRRSHEEILARTTRSIGSEAWFRVNAAFHETLSACSGNRFFLQAIRQQNSLRRLQEYAAFQRLPRERVEQSCREHLAILDALEAGDAEWAEAMMRRHLRQAAAVPSPSPAPPID